MKTSLLVSAVALILIMAASPAFFNGIIPQVSASAISPPRGVGAGSWNPHVPCTSPWIVRISDITDNQTESSSLSNSMFSPGITENPNVTGTAGAKRWLTPGATPPGWHNPGPSCMITNNKGQTVAAFVEIDGVARASWTYEDCRTSYDAVNGGSVFKNGQWCDSTGNLFDPILVPNYSTSCTSPTDPTCWGRIHVEFDGDWMAAGYCGTSTTYCNNDTLVKQTAQGSTSTLIDVQGYVFWDPEHVTAADHSFSGWELHALTAWRPHQSTSSQDSVIQITPTGCPNATNCASGGYPTESSFFLPFTQQKIFQNPRPTSRQDYYVFYRQNMSIPGSGCSGGVGPDFCDECVYAYSPNGVAWRVNQTIGSGPAGVGNFFYNCSATYFDNAANNQLVIYVAVARNSATVNIGHDVEFVIGTVADNAETINWGTVQVVSSSSSKQNFQFPVLQIDPNGYLQIAYSWVDSFISTQTVDLCSSRTPYPTTDPSWTCNGGNNNSLFDARTQPGQTDASFMPQLQPMPGHSVLVLQGPCSNTATANCDGPSSLTENATLVNWDGTSQTFIRTATFTYSSLSASDRRSSIADRATGTFFVAYENGTDGKFWTRYLAKPYTSWTSPTRITSDDGEGRLSLLSGTRSAKTIAFVEAVDAPLTVSGGGGRGSCGTCPQIDMYTNTTTNGTSWSLATALYSNTTWAAAWDSIPWYVNTTTTSTLPVMWEQHDCGIGTNVACTAQPEELWFDPHSLFAPTVPPPPNPSFAVVTTFDGRIYRYLQNGSLVFISRPVGSALRQVAWKPDGSYALIVGDQGVVYRYDGTTLTRFTSAVIGNTNLNTVAWKPDGSYALIGGQNGFIFQYNGTAVTKIPDPTTSNIFSISWNPNGDSALIVGDKGTALIYTLPSKITVLHSGTGAPLFTAAWNPSGAYALAAGGNGVVLLFNGTAFKTLSTTGLAQAGHNIRFIAFSPTSSPGILVGDAGLVWTYNGTKLSSIISGTNNNLFSLSWLGNKAYIVGQNGSLFTYSAGTLTKLASGTNVNFSSIAWQPNPLSVRITFSPTSPTVQGLVSFLASPNGGVAPYSFNWSFGDGTSAVGNIVAHEYSLAGTFNVTVTVTDSLTSTSRASSLVIVQPPSPPTITVSTPTPNPASTVATVNLNFAVSSSTNVTGIVVNWGDGSSLDHLPGTATVDTHAYASTGTFQSQVFNITVTASNSGGSGSGITTETVIDRQPTTTVSSIAPNPAITGQLVNGTFTASDSDGTVTSITVNWGDGSLDTLSGTTTSDTHAYASTGTFTITITATDNSGSKGQAVAQETVQTQTAPPTVTVSSPTPNPAKTGTTVGLSFTISSSAPATGITVSWGDGTVDNLPGTATSDIHIYASTGSAQSEVFTINVTATTSAGSGFGTATETVNDQPPSVAISSVTSPANTGQIVNVTFTANDPDGSLSSISVKWGDGSPVDVLPGTSTLDSHTYSSTGNATSRIFTLTISVSDNSGSVSQASTTITINDRSPIVTVSGPSPNPILVGQTVTVNFSTNDPDGSVSSITVNWGDGSQPDSLPGTATSDTHAYGTGGTFTITVTATDNSGSQGSGTTSESVTAPLAPTVTINSVSPNPANTGQTVTVNFTVSSTIPVTGVTVNWGDGSIDNLAGSSVSDTHVYASTGNLQSQTFAVIVTATNTAGSGSASTSASINDQAPTITVTTVSPNPATVGSTVTTTFTASDSDGTISSITVNWGDGSTVDNLAGTVTSDTHSYATAGNFTVTIGATDNSGSKAQTTATVTVKPVTTSTPYALSVTSDGKVYKTYTNGTMVLIGQPVTSQLRSVSWRPDGSYALISGDSAVLLKYDGTQLTTISTGISTGFNFWSVSWKPDGSYALIAGTQGLLFKYDGTTITMINDPNTLTIFSVSWNPTGTSALLVGKTGTVLTFDGTAVHSLTSGTSFDLDAIGWTPNGSYALIGGLNGTVLRYDGTQVTALLTSGGLAGTNEIKSIAFNPQGTLALLVGDNGMVLTYNGSTFTKLAQVTFSWLYSVTWGPNGTAYILGNSGNELTYSNGTLTKVSSGNTSSYRASAWKP